MQEYWRISSLSDAEVQYLDKQKIQDLIGGSIFVGTVKVPAPALGNVVFSIKAAVRIKASNASVRSGHRPYLVKITIKPPFFACNG